MLALFDFTNEDVLDLMSELQAVTGQLYIVDGVMQAITAQEGVPGLLAQPAPSRPARSRDRDYLFVHLVLTGPDEETAVLNQDLLDALSRKFYATGGSVTAALRGAIQHANQLLLRHNLSSSGPTREGAITCAVLRQSELFTLQAGESLALLGHNFGVERLPPQPRQQVTPLGRSSGLDIRYYHHRLQTGDMLLLADPRLSHLPANAFAPALVDTQIEYGLDELITIVGGESARLLLVEFGDETPIDLPETAVQPAAREGQTIAPTPQPRRDPDNVPVVTTSERRPQPKRAVNRRQPIREADGSQGRPSLPAVHLNMEEVEIGARRAGSQAVLGLSNFTAWLADLLARLRPPHAEEAEEEPIGWFGPAIVAVVIPILIAVIVSGVYLERGRVQRLSEIRTEMQTAITLAGEVGDDANLARQYYNQALALALEAETELRPGDEEVGRLRSLARERLDELDGITRLTARPFFEYQTEGTALTAVVLREGFNGGVYTLDQGNGFVYEHQTDETYVNATSPEPLRLLFNGEAIGSHVVGSIVDIMWRPQGTAVTRDGLAMLDSNGALLTYQPSLGNTFAVPLDLSSGWEAPIGMATFDERLYVLDIGTRVIWKYFPNGDDFIVQSDEQTLALDGALALEQAIDFEIFSEDASLLLLYRDGRVRYYDTSSGRLQWDETDMLANGLGAPLAAPTAVHIVGRGLNASIFIADPGTGRIVQVSRPTGQVLAQYRATGPDGEELFANITDFAAAETPLRLFVTSENVLYTAVQE